MGGSIGIGFWFPYTFNIGMMLNIYTFHSSSTPASFMSFSPACQTHENMCVFIFFYKNIVWHATYNHITVVSWILLFDSASRDFLWFSIHILIKGVVGLSFCCGAYGSLISHICVLNRYSGKIYSITLYLHEIPNPRNAK